MRKREEKREEKSEKEERDPGALSSGDEGFAEISEVEDGRGLDVVPVLLGEGIRGLLLPSFLPL